MKYPELKTPVFTYSAICLVGAVLLSAYFFRDSMDGKPPLQVEESDSNRQAANQKKEIAATDPEGNLVAASHTEEEQPPPEPAQKNTPFVFPEDASGQQLSQKLPPGVEAKFPRFPTAGKQQIKAASQVASPAVPLPPVSGMIPQLPANSNPLKTQPAPVPEEVPLTEYAGVPNLPEIQKLEVGPPVSVPSIDVNQPPVLVKVKDAAPDAQNLADPTQAASHQAALQGTPPQRTEPAPFLRLNLPDPFANRKIGTPAETLPEDEMPVTVTPVLPGK